MVVVVAGAGDVVVVVAAPTGAVVLVVVAPVVVLVVVDDVEVVDVVVVVVDGVVVGVVAGACGGVTRSLSVVPASDPPKIAESGLPEISSIAVMNNKASTNTTAALAAMARQENRPASAGRRTAGRIGLVEARRRSVAGASATAEISSSVSRTGAAVDSIWTVSAFPSSRGPERTTSVGADDADDEADADDVASVSPLEPVPPSLRNSVAVSGALTATCLTASWPRSIDCATNAVAMVAAAEPMATPTIVPLTPKVEAMIAATTAPAVEARICRNENFTTWVSTRPPRV